MKNEILISLTRVVDDSTGMYSVGELDFGLYGTLQEYLRVDPLKRRDAIFAMLGVIMVQVNNQAIDLLPKQEANAKCES